MHLDKKNYVILVGHNVNVPTPNETDIYNHEFVGSVIDITENFICVEDGDGDCFSIEPDRVEINTDNDEVLFTLKDVRHFLNFYGQNREELESNLVLGGIDEDELEAIISDGYVVSTLLNEVERYVPKTNMDYGELEEEILSFLRT